MAQNTAFLTATYFNRGKQEENVREGRMLGKEKSTFRVSELNKCVCNRCIYGTMRFGSWQRRRESGAEVRNLVTYTHTHAHQTGPNYSLSLFFFRSLEQRMWNGDVTELSLIRRNGHPLSRFTCFHVKEHVHTHTYLEAGPIDGPSVNEKLGSISITRSSVAICRNAEDCRKKEQSLPHPFVCRGSCHPTAPFLRHHSMHIPPQGDRFAAIDNGVLIWSKLQMGTGGDSLQPDMRGRRGGEFGCYSIFNPFHAVP